MSLRRTSVSRELRAMRRALQSIQTSLRRLTPLVDGEPIEAPVPSAVRLPRKLTLSPARRVALKLQGQYMGYMRGLKPRQKARVKTLAASKDIRAAIELARRLAGS